MTIKQVQDRGFRERHEHGDSAKLEWQRMDSARRFMELAWVLEARRIAIRAAHRRFLRRSGRRFASA